MVSKTFISLAALASIASAQSRVARPCYSGNCDKCTEDTYEITKGVPDVNDYPSFTAKGFTQSTNMTGGYNVWWDVNHPGQGCAILIYEASSQNNGTAWGNVVLEARSAGCFFANMGGSQWATQFCCGDGDCGKVQPGGMTYTAKYPAPPDNELPGPSSTPSAIPSVVPSQTSGLAGPAVPATGAPAPLKRYARHQKAALERRDPQPICDNPDLTKWFDCTDKEWAPAPPSCKTTTTEPYQSAGQQVQAAANINCNVGANCGITHTDTVTVTETLTNDHTVTTTTNNGISVSINAGFSFGQQGGTGFNVGASVGYTHDWGKSIADSTGFSNATAEAIANAYTFSPPIGVDGFLSFTPALECTNQHTVCDGVEMDFEHCKPILSSDGKATGDYLWVTIGM